MNKTYIFAKETEKFQRGAFTTVYPLLSLTSKAILPELYSKRTTIGEVNIYLDSDMGLDIMKQLEKDFKGRVIYHINFDLTPLATVLKLTGLRKEMKDNIIKYHRKDKTYFSGKNSIKYWEV